MRRHEKPLKRVNPSGKTVWVARWTDQAGQRRHGWPPEINGTYALKGPCRSEESAAGACCAQHAIDACYEREREGDGGPRTGTVGMYAEGTGRPGTSWTDRHPRTERTNIGYVSKLRQVLDVPISDPKLKVKDRKLRDWPMSDVRRRHANDLVDYMLREEQRAARGAQNVLRVLSAMWTDALDDEWVDANVFYGVKVKMSDVRVVKPARRIRTWSWEQMHAIAAAAGDDEPMLRMLIDLGLRVGELFPLERSDLWRGACSDELLSECEVVVPHVHVTKTMWRGQVTRGTKEDRLREAQGGKPWRVGRAVPISPGTLEVLGARPPRIDTPLLFPMPNGEPWAGDWRFYKRVWHPARAAAGLPLATPHEMRHSWISLMRAAGVDPADLAAMSGHTVETATKIYTHALGKSFEAAAAAVGA